jgi:RNA-directed DNA polymerase
MVARANRSFDRRTPWMLPLAREVLASYDRAPLDRPRELAAFIALALGALPRPEDTTGPPRVRRWLIPESTMGRVRWPVPELASVGALAEFLEVSVGELEWFADARGLERTVADERLRNYLYCAIPRRGGPPRLIERPKLRLKSLQRRLLHEILEWIPVHDAAHGFTRGRSAVTNAKQHTGRLVVVRLDLEDFFASITARRVFGIFRAAGYPESVAYALTALSSNVVPLTVSRQLSDATDPRWTGSQLRLVRRLATPHLPQGAPTSPALANLAAFRLDRRLAGLANALGATYTRYADDITLSGSDRLLRNASGLRRQIAEIAQEEGFAVNDRKSTLTTRAGRQQVCGVVVNQRTNVARVDYDTLKATIHNAARHGPESQNRTGVPDFRAHLIGRIAWVEQLHPEHGAQLRRKFERIVWPSGI